MRRAGLWIAGLSICLALLLGIASRFAGLLQPGDDIILLGFPIAFGAILALAGWILEGFSKQVS